LAKFSIRHPFRSLGRILRDIVRGPEREPPKEKEPPPEPPRGPDYFPPFDNYEYDDTRKEIWQYVTGERLDDPEGEEYWDLFGDTGIPLAENYSNTNDAWDEFLRSFWLNSSEDGSVPRSDFYDDWDVTRAQIDWPHWREIKKTP